MTKKHEETGQTCGTCRHFDHCDPDDTDGPDGYCCHPFHSTWFSPHHEYGGHWTDSTSWCDLWTPGPSVWREDVTEAKS